MYEFRNVWLTLLIFVVIGVVSGSAPSTKNQVVVPENGAILDLSTRTNGFLKVALNHTLGDPSEVIFKVTPPEGHGVTVVIRRMTLRKGVPVIGPKQCYEYIEFNSSDDSTNSAFVCGSITDNEFELVGRRSFVSGINKSVNVKVHFSNEVFQEESSSTTAGSPKSTFILDTTAYSACPTSNFAANFACSSTICVDATLSCDGDYNCPLDNDRDLPKDERYCHTSKRESQPSLTTSKPLLTSGITSERWPWFWARKDTSTMTTTTTESPMVISHVYDHDHDTGFSWWNSQWPIIIVTLAFMAIAGLLFLTCSFLAMWNTRHHHGAAESSEPSSLRSQELGVPNHYSIPAPQGRIYFYPECDNRAYASTPPPPAYAENGIEDPPSYNTIFRKSPSSLYSSKSPRDSPTVAHTISTRPIVYDPPSPDTEAGHCLTGIRGSPVPTRESNRTETSTNERLRWNFVQLW